MDGTFWAGCIELAGVDDCEGTGHLSSAFEGGGLRPSNMSDVESDDSAIVAF